MALRVLAPVGLLGVALVWEALEHSAVWAPVVEAVLEPLVALVPQVAESLWDWPVLEEAKLAVQRAKALENLLGLLAG